jgi:polyhydroxyalkanoate synthase
MIHPLEPEGSALAPKLAAPQHKPRPLPLFLEMLRSETGGEPSRMVQALKGLRAYQEATRSPPMPLMPVIAEVEGAKLRDYGGEGADLLFVPSLINPPSILDLSKEKSLLRWLAGRGHRVLLVDWGWHNEDRRNLSVAGYVDRMLVPLMETLEQPPAVAGYCLGGTMAIAAAMVTEVRRLALLAAPWHFARFPETSRTSLARLWEGARGPTEAMGLLPMEVLQSAFWSLDPARTIAKFEAFAAMDPQSAEAASFVTLEDWANDGPPLSEAAARELFEDFFDADLPGGGAWKVRGVTVDPGVLTCPLLNLVSTTDRIVPHESATDAGERLDFRQGHVGMIVGGSARGALWEPLDAWLSHGRGE